METRRTKIEFFMQPAINTGFQTYVGCNQELNY